MEIWKSGNKSIAQLKAIADAYGVDPCSAKC